MEPRALPREEAMKANEAHQRIMLPQQLAWFFESLPDGVIACDDEGQILQINAAARKLFEVPSLALYRETSYHQFLQHHQPGDQQQQAIALEPWLMSLLIDEEATSSRQEEPIVLLVPSGRKVYVTIRCSSVLDAQQHALGTAYVFHDLTHRYQKALRLQRVHHAVATLTEAIAHLPAHLDFASPEGTIFLLSPPVLFVAQQLVDVLRHVLDCQHVGLLALGPACHLHYAVGGGFTPEQEQFVQARIGGFLPSDLLDETALARLDAGQEVMLSSDRMRLPPELRAEFGAAHFLLVPLFLEQQMVGALFIARAGVDSGYAPEEIELVKAVAAETVLVIDCLLCLCEHAEVRARALAQQEMYRLTNEFLNLAGHELNTPLTGIKGNLQLAQRRLAALKRQLAEQPGRVDEHVEQVQQPLASAVQSERRLERMIKQLIDDMRLQTNTLDLHMQRCDLRLLLKEAVATQQRLTPERTIVLENMAPEQVVPIIADPERITQVITNYLANALSYSPADQPVTVQLTIKDARARVSVHDEGPVLPAEEQGHIWGRYFYAKGATTQDELDLSLGLSFYLCQAFIERHHGSVGVQSEPGHGATFWFTLPIAVSPEG
jgi:signal transduction histidine kinase